MEQTTRKVSEFESPRGKNPLCYPGDRAGHSFVTDGETVMPLAYEDPSDVRSAIILTGERMESLEDYLEDRGATPIGERLATMGYGSNAAPGALKSKELKDRKENEIVPVINASIKGWDAVYNFMSAQGYAYAELARKESEEAELEVVVTLLDEKQLPIMNETEKNYDLSIFPGIVLETGQTIDGYGYAGTSRIFAPDRYRDGDERRPVALREIRAEGRKLPELCQEEVLDLAVEELELNRRPFRISGGRELSEIVKRGGFEGERVLDYVKEKVRSEKSLENATGHLAKEKTPSEPEYSFDQMLKEGQRMK